jgi:hypothetical protein
MRRDAIKVGTQYVGSHEAPGLRTLLAMTVYEVQEAVFH